MERNGHILSSGGTLLGVALALVAGLKVSGSAGKTMADEIAGVGALLIAIACGLSYLALRAKQGGSAWERRADAAFLGGIGVLIAAVAVLVLSDLS